MNPLTNVRNINKLNEIELQKGFVDKKSWHDLYKESAWIFIGGLTYGLTEGDILSVFSQYGEIVNINLIRDKKTGKTKGFCFLCYANQKSTILAVDNFNGIKLCGRTIRVDHVANYKPPKEDDNDDEMLKQLKLDGCAPRPIKQEKTSPIREVPIKKEKKMKIKKEKKKHKKNKHGMKIPKKVKVKKEKQDSSNKKHEHPQMIEKLSKHKKTSAESSDSEEDSSSTESSDSASRRKNKSGMEDSSQRKHQDRSLNSRLNEDSSSNRHAKSREDDRYYRDENNKRKYDTDKPRSKRRRDSSASSSENVDTGTKDRNERKAHLYSDGKNKKPRGCEDEHSRENEHSSRYYRDKKSRKSHSRRRDSDD